MSIEYVETARVCRAQRTARLGARISSRRQHALSRLKAVMRVGVLSLAFVIALAARPDAGKAQGPAEEAGPLKARHLGAPRERATKYPRSEDDQAVVDGWPLYRTERGQIAFNDAMATLRATDGAAPVAAAFKHCEALHCQLTLPAIGRDGWLPPGRLWVSPTQYVLFAHSPRQRAGRSMRRHSARSMRYFVFHEFHNSSRNNDTYDTISSHSGSVFVPFYLSKQGNDAKGRRFVVVLQVAPYDVVSIHASNKGSAGPGVEVAKGASDELEPLQSLAGIVLASVVKSAAPQLQVVNHRGNEGLPMLTAYEQRLSALRSQRSAPVALPFTPAAPQRVASVTGHIADLIARRGSSPPVPMAERAFAPRPVRAAFLLPGVATPLRTTPAEPMLIEPVMLATPPPCLPGRTGGEAPCRHRNAAIP